jgi:SAM-dependent methyltransferase
MEYKGSTVYDNEEFFKKYIDRRHRNDSPNILIEKPVLFELLEDVNDHDILDLGCGDASLGIDLLKNGAKSYLGIEGSKKMVQKAILNLENTAGKIEHATMEEYAFPESTFDLVVSQLAIHYIEDFSKLSQSVYKTLKFGGKFIFSVQHPLLTSSFESMTKNGKRFNWIVDDYFQTGKRVEPWIGEQVVKYHRTIDEYFSTLQEAGFIINKLREPRPQKQYFSDEEEYNRRLRIPLFLLFSCTKPLK